MSKLKLPVHEIIPFANVDGSGNRTAIFVQGCNLNCVYCHNPETIQMPCENTEHTDYSLEELMDEIKKYAPYIRGITVSGGEATIYKNFLVELFKEVKKLGLTCYIDTNGIFIKEKLADLIQVTDKFLFDIKGIDKLASVTRKNLKFSFENLDYLLSLNKIEEVRTVCINDFSDTENTVRQVAERIKDREDILYKIIRVHTRGLEEDQVENIGDSVPSKKEVVRLGKLADSLGAKNVRVIF